MTSPPMRSRVDGRAPYPDGSPPQRWSERGGLASATPGWLPGFHTPTRRFLGFTRHLEGWALLAFCAAVMFVHGYGLLPYFGAGLVLAFALANVTRVRALVSRTVPAPPELLIYTAWVAWAGLTGGIAANYLDAFLYNYGVVVQMLVMVWVCYAIVAKLQSTDVILLGMLVGGMVQIALVLHGGPAEAREQGGREVGTTSNPNILGFLMVDTVLAATAFWRLPTRLPRLKKALIVALIPVAVYVLLVSGSRKSSLAMALVVFSWATLGARRISTWRGLLASAFVGLILVLAAQQLMPKIREETAAGQRFDALYQEGRGDPTEARGATGRIEMYIEGLQIAIDNPLLGVGLNQVQRYTSTGLMTHSDYVEPLAATGFLGFFLYQGWKVLLALRLLGLLKVVVDPDVRYRLKVGLITLAAVLLVGAGSPHFTAHPVVLMLVVYSAYTWRLQREIRAGSHARHGHTLSQAAATARR